MLYYTQYTQIYFFALLLSYLLYSAERSEKDSHLSQTELINTDVAMQLHQSLGGLVHVQLLKVCMENTLSYVPLG